VESLWRPFRTAVIRNLFAAALLSDIGTFMQSVGAAWLMVSMGASATFVGLTQTASALPFFVLALPAGAIGDIVDRRKLILLCEYWMVAVTIVLAAATIGGFMSPTSGGHGLVRKASHPARRAYSSAHAHPLARNPQHACRVRRPAGRGRMLVDAVLLRFCIRPP
jgi:MFS family permease